MRNISNKNGRAVRRREQPDPTTALSVDDSVESHCTPLPLDSPSLCENVESSGEPPIPNPPAFTFVGPRPEHVSDWEEKDWLEGQMLLHSIGEFVSRTHNAYRNELILDGSLFISEEEFARRFGKDLFSEEWVRELIEKGKIPCYKTTDGRHWIDVRRLANHFGMDGRFIALTLENVIWYYSEV